MKFDPQKNRRRSIRLKGYDYTQPGAYFITICAYQSESLFGEVRNNKMALNSCGEIVHNVWQGLPNHYPHVQLGDFCIMPNHIHPIIILTDSDIGRGGFETRPYSPDASYPHDPYETRPHVPKRHALPEIVRALKTFSARHINEHRDSSGAPVWQRNYYEHIIRNKRELYAIQKYILSNPLNWASDQDNPINQKPTFDPKE